MGKMTRERLARMTDDELLAYKRERNGDPYMNLADAKAATEDGPGVLAHEGTQGEGRAGGRGRAIDTDEAGS